MAQRADIAITAAGQKVGTLRQASVSMRFSLLPAAAEETYGWQRQVPGTHSWGAGGSVFVPSEGDAGQDALRDAITGRTTVSVTLTWGDGSTETGTAVVTSWEVSGQIGAAVSGSFSLQGVGALL